MEARATLQGMPQRFPHISSLLELLKEAALETAWPTRCVLCDVPGTLLCEPCARSLPYIDFWRACPVCGAPYGLVQCCLCNPVMMPPGFEEPPFDGCVSAVHLTRETGRMATVFKDHNERGLAKVMAGLIAWTIPPAWATEISAITFVPATASSLRKRGFDHAELLAGELARKLERPVVPLFLRPGSVDQRNLAREERFANMRHRIVVSDKASVPESPLLVDDVFTTGATLFAACEALQAHGTRNIRCATFARA